MNAPFHHRSQAGELLARSLSHLAGREDVTVLALPPGGVPVAFEVARALGAPLDLALVQPILHSLGPPRRDVTLGLLGYPTTLQLQEATLNALDLSDEALTRDLARTRRRLHERVNALRPSAPMPSLAGRTVVLVDDGTAAGVVLRRAAVLLRRTGVRALVAAVPVGSDEGLRLLDRDFDEVVCCVRLEPFVAVPDGYACYPDVTDEEVRALLARAWSGHTLHGHALPPPGATESPGSSSERHRYQLATVRQGRQRSP